MWGWKEKEEKEKEKRRFLSSPALGAVSYLVETPFRAEYRRPRVIPTRHRVLPFCSFSRFGSKERQKEKQTIR